MSFAISGHGSFFLLKGGQLYFALFLNILPLCSHEVLCVPNVEDCPEQRKCTPVMVTRLKTLASCAPLMRQPGFTLCSLSAGYWRPLGYHPTESFHLRYKIKSTKALPCDELKPTADLAELCPPALLINPGLRQSVLFLSQAKTTLRVAKQHLAQCVMAENVPFQ